METKPDKQQTVTRLALCVVVAVALYAAAGNVPPLEPYRPWLEEHFSRRRRAGQGHRPRKRAPAPGTKERRTCRKGGPPLTLRRRSGVQPWSSTGTAAAAPRQ